ncbi:MAG TPA: imidazole glycerol phosphate synthase subunit HisH [Methyloceanibacter sp.]|nr:imidazole glycerol phosphate synthase subunit HisH [Methyloceanibacter sp.]
MTVLIVDYGRGNLFSLGQALRQLGVPHEVSSDPEKLAKSKRVIFPGVGAFGDAMRELRERGLVEPFKAAAAKGTPILGICVGCQLLLRKGEEFGEHAGLDIISGIVRRLPEPRAQDPAAMRIPNIGWRPITVRADGSVLGPAGAGGMYYFVHSYAPWPENPEHVTATIEMNGQEVPVAVQRNNLIGVQFHPEKSGPAGLELLARFTNA